MTREHFAEVERSVAGLLRCERDGALIVCRLLGRWPGLVFVADATEWGPHAVTVRWRILGGLLAQLEPVLSEIVLRGLRRSCATIRSTSSRVRRACWSPR